MSTISAKHKKPKLRTLSLFDGIGTGFYALSRLNIDMDCYYASEIDEDALRVSNHHFGNGIKHLGCVMKITEKTIKEIGPIHLLLGGSPCTDLACVNFLRKGLYDVNGTGVLFFDFYRIKNILDQMRQPYYWLFENVSHMESENKNVISKFLGREPYTVDAVNVTPQFRSRYFWTNLPGIDAIIQNLNNNKGPTLHQYLDENLGRKANVDKVRTITTKRSCLQDGSSRDPVSENGVLTGLYITEIEKIFGFPAHFTDVGDMKIKKRQRLLGSSWSVPVIEHLLRPLTNFFATK